MQSQTLKLALMGGVILGLSLASAPTLHSRTKCPPANAPAGCPEDLKECQKKLEDCEEEIPECLEATSDALKQNLTLCDYLSIDKKGVNIYSRLVTLHEKKHLDDISLTGLINVIKEASAKGGCP